MDFWNGNKLIQRSKFLIERIRFNCMELCNKNLFLNESNNIQRKLLERVKNTDETKLVI